MLIFVNILLSSTGRYLWMSAMSLKFYILEFNNVYFGRGILYIFSVYKVKSKTKFWMKNFRTLNRTVLEKL